MEYLPTYLLTGALIGGVYALVALGVVAVYKVSKVFNFAVGELVIMGGLVAISCMNIFPSWGGVMLALVAMGVVGLLLHWVIVGRFVRQSAITAMMVTAVLTYLISGLSAVGWSGVGRPIPRFLPAGQFSVGPGVVGLDLMWSSVIGLIGFGLLIFLFQRTKVGLGMRSTAEDHEVAEAKGVNIEWMYRIAWIIAGVTATLGGVFMGYRTGMEPSLALIGLKAFPVVFLGGVDSFGGALVGGLTIGMMEQLVGGYVGSEWADFTPFLILLLVLALRPEGIFGVRRVERI